MAFLSTASLSVKLSMIVFEGDTAMGLMYALAKEDELQSLEVADGLQTYVTFARVGFPRVDYIICASSGGRYKRQGIHHLTQVFHLLLERTKENSKKKKVKL